MSIPSQCRTQDGILAPTKPRAGPSQKSHHDLHQEVFRDSPICTPSGTGSSRSEVRLRSLNVLPHYSHRRISTTRSPTGPALHKPATPPALPNKFSIPPSPTNGILRSPNVMAQMAELRAEASTTHRFSLSSRTPPRDAVTTTRRMSMILPL